MTGFTISCDDCVMQGTATCDDCVVTFLCRRSPDDAVVIDAAEVRAVRVLERAGLAPGLRHVPRGLSPAPAAAPAPAGSAG